MKGMTAVLLISVLVIGLFAGYFIGHYVAPPTPSELDSVLLRLDFTIKGTHVGPFVGLEKGYYRDEGIDINIGAGRGSEQTVLEVATGTADIGLANIDQILAARDLGYDLVMIGMLYNVPPYGFSTRADDNIETPQDLIGKTITFSTGNEEYLRKWFAANNIDMDTQVDAITMDWTVGMSQLLLKQSQGLYSYYGSLYTLIYLQGQDEGVDIDFLFLGEHNWPVYGSAWFTNAQLIDEKPALVEGFMRATWKGYDYYVKNPTDAINILRKYHPELAENEAKLQAQQSIEMTISPETLEHGYGYMLEDKIAGTIQILGETMSASDTYTNDYVFEDLKPPTSPPT